MLGSFHFFEAFPNLSYRPERVWPGTESNRRHEDFQSSALPTELPGQDFGILRKKFSESRSIGTFGELSCFLLDKIDDRPFDPHVVKCVDFLNASRTSDVNLGKVTANHIQAHKIEPGFFQMGRKDAADLSVPGG